MLSLVSDENVSGPLIRGLRDYAIEQGVDLDLVLAVEAGLGETPDPDVLEWAANAERVLITQDRRTLIRFAQDRVDAGLPMPGVIVLRTSVSSSELIEALAMMAACCTPEEIKDRIQFVPE